MTEEAIFIRPPTVDGPITVLNPRGDIVLTIGEEIHQADGLSRAFNLSGTPYQSVVFGYKAQRIEEIEDFGHAAIFDAFRAWAEKLTQDEDFYSIEWRVPPTLEDPTEYHAPATIVDAETGAHRSGLEVLWACQLRCRLVVHKRSARPVSDIEGAKTEFVPINWLKATRPAVKDAA